MIKNVVILDPNWSFETFQSFYLGPNRKRIKPNIVILKPPEMTKYFETNAYGFKGSDVDSSKKLVAIWGDSVVFGIGQSWIEGLSDYFSDYQFLNGGLEGDPLENICERMIEGNDKLNIKHNVIFPGWHTRCFPDRACSLLSKAVNNIPGVILCTVPTSLSEKVVEIDLTPYFNTSTNLDEAYFFFGSISYSIENAKCLLKELQMQNEVIYKVSKEYNVPLIDLYSYFYTDNLDKFKEDFFDACHPRPKAYPKIQKAFWEGLKNVLV